MCKASCRPKFLYVLSTTDDYFYLKTKQKGGMDLPRKDLETFFVSVSSITTVLAQPAELRHNFEDHLRKQFTGTPRFRAGRSLTNVEGYSTSGEPTR